MNLFASPSVDSRFTQRHFQICYMCAGISSKHLAPEYRDSLCCHHEHIYQNYLFEKYSKEDAAWEEGIEKRNLQIILHQAKVQEQQNKNSSKTNERNNS